MVTLTKEQLVKVNKASKQADNFGDALHQALDSIGNRFGVYHVMYQSGPITPACLATQAGISEKDARVWLDAQADTNSLKRSLSTGLYCI